MINSKEKENRFVNLQTNINNWMTQCDDNDSDGLFWVVFLNILIDEVELIKENHEKISEYISVENITAIAIENAVDIVIDPIEDRTTALILASLKVAMFEVQYDFMSMLFKRGSELNELTPFGEKVHNYSFRGDKS